MATLDFQAFDADNHYYEARDAFTRRIEPQYAKWAMQWAEVNGRTRLHDAFWSLVNDALTTVGGVPQ
jgi:hypothetical protein